MEEKTYQVWTGTEFSVGFSLEELKKKAAMLVVKGIPEGVQYQFIGFVERTVDRRSFQQGNWYRRPARFLSDEEVQNMGRFSLIFLDPTGEKPRFSPEEYLQFTNMLPYVEISVRCCS